MMFLKISQYVAALALAEGYGYYRPGFRRSQNGIAAAYNNAERQESVNYRAEHVGAPSGTASYDGGLNFGYHSYGGYGNYGYRSYDNDHYNH